MIARFLRKMGLCFSRKAAIAEIEEARSENMRRAADANALAHSEMKRIYEEEVPRSTKLRTSIEKSAAPFADFEEIMHNHPERRRKIGRQET